MKSENLKMRKILAKQFFNRSSVHVAQDLLGKFLVHKIGKREAALQITETEAYEGSEDLASHASGGRTKRNEVMFGEAGRFYIYLCYGMHHMINIVTGQFDFPAAVLIRGGIDKNSDLIISGPGRVSKFLKVDLKLNGASANIKSGLWFEDRGEKILPSSVCRSPRIGVSYAGPIWSKKDFRFFLKNNVNSPRKKLTSKRS